MLIKIGERTREYMDLLGIREYPFTYKQLKTSFIQAIKLNHPDINNNSPKSNDKTKKINNAFESLKNLALADITDSDTLQREEQFDKIKEDTFGLWGPCKSCNGSGKTTRRKLPNQKVICTACKGTGIRIIKCKYCDNGIFHFANGKTVKCRTCKGTGIFKTLHSICTFCHGFGMWYKEEVETVPCLECKGTGKTEIKPFNPAIRKGAVLF